LQIYVTAYNDTLHSTTGVAVAKVSDLNVLKIWQKIESNNIKKVPVVKLKSKLGQYVRISKEKMRFAKGAEQNYSTQIFQISE
jgi:hypothetical protein